MLIPYLILTPLLVLAVVLLFGFVGCTSFGASSSAATGADYPSTIKKETSLVGYWRLGEPASTAIAPPPPGGIAKDEQGTHPGHYFHFQPAPGADTKRHSFSNPAVINLGQKPGLLEKEASETCVEFNGGWVDMGFDAVLNPPQFTLEAWVFPQLDGDPLGNFYCLCETGAPATGKQKTEGFGLYAGPGDPTNPTSPYEWQIWMGDGTNFTKVANSLPSPAAVKSQLTYVVLTYDGSNVLLFVYIPNTGQELSNNSVAPLQGKFTGYKPATTGSLVVGAGRNLFPAVPGAAPKMLYAFHGKIQEVALYNKALTVGDSLVAHEQAGGSF